MADAAYGLWPLVVLNTLPALFTGMYGAPLTIHLPGSRLGNQFPPLQDTHAGGHPWNDLTGWTGDPHLSPLHLAGYVALGAGFRLIAEARCGDRWDTYAARPPAFWPRRPHRAPAGPRDGAPQAPEPQPSGRR